MVVNNPPLKTGDRFQYQGEGVRLITLPVRSFNPDPYVTILRDSGGALSVPFSKLTPELQSATLSLEVQPTMITVYLSDEAFEILQKNDVPSEGQHIGKFLLVLQEAIQHDPKQTNQIGLGQTPTIILNEVVRESPSFAENAPLTTTQHQFLTALKENAVRATSIVWETPKDGVPTPKPAKSPEQLTLLEEALPKARKPRAKDTFES